MKVGFIGGGNMASAIIGGMLAKGFAPARFHVVEIGADRRRELERLFAITAAQAADGALDSCDVLVLAVKPQQMRAASQSILPHLKQQLVITIAAGICLADLSRWLGGYLNLVRAMPNTPALIHAGIAGLYAMPQVSAADRERAAMLLGVVGETVWFDQEAMLDAVTAVSGSGPAYVFYFIEALQQAALDLGMTPAQARMLALHTFLGAGKLAAQSEDSPATLRAKVTSKGGTTERALSVMETGQLKAKFIEAIKSAAARSKELGEEFGKD
jgi:pyrroline-5-carboxylate reductase